MPTIVRLFWKEGFGRMTLDQVASALSVTKPTLFRTLGDKEGIFAKALQAYYQTHIRPGEERLEAATTLREGVEGCFAFSVARILDPNNPHGCFLTDTTLSGEFTTGPIAETIETLQDHTLQLLRRRAHEAIDSGELRPTTDPDAVVRYLLAQFAALSAVSRLDADRESLDAIVGFMVDGLPWAT
ncbi:MAG: TetR/AcrR family transcriptional regulator [Myxococcota bacterium]